MKKNIYFIIINILLFLAFLFKQNFINKIKLTDYILFSIE